MTIDGFIQTLIEKTREDKIYWGKDLQNNSSYWSQVGDYTIQIDNSDHIHVFKGNEKIFDCYRNNIFALRQLIHSVEDVKQKEIIDSTTEEIVSLLQESVPKIKDGQSPQVLPSCVMPTGNSSC